MSKLKQPHKFYRVLELIKNGVDVMAALESEFGSDFNTLERNYEELAEKYPNAVRAYERASA